MHENCRLLFNRYALPFFATGHRVLEIGPLVMPSDFQKAVGNKAEVWDTLNITSTPGLTYAGVAEYSYPIAGGVYDVVFSNQVIEHVRNPWIWMKELVRICKVGGVVINISPVSWPYHGPPDYWRIYPEGMRTLYEESGLRCILSECESLEVPGYRRYWPRYSFQSLPWTRRLIHRILGRIGLPVPCALDTIAIGEKL